MSLKLNTPNGWKATTPSKINTPNGWKQVQVVKVSTPNGWQQVFPDISAEPEVVTEIRVVKTAPMTYQFTAWGGSGTYFWDFDGDSATNETAKYGEKVIEYTYKYAGYKTATCMDMAGNATQQGVKVSVDVTVSN